MAARLGGLLAFYLNQYTYIILAMSREKRELAIELHTETLEIEELKTKEATPEQVKIFNTELMPHINALYTFAYHLTYNEADSDDLVQETYLRAFRFISSYITGTNAKAWLFRILKNAFINQYRKRERTPQTIDYEVISAYHDSEENISRDFYNLSEELFGLMMGDEITSAMNSLPTEFRTIVLLCDVEDFTYEETAKIIDIPLGTVRSRLHRARNILKEKLKKYAESFGYKDMRRTTKGAII